MEIAFSFQDNFLIVDYRSYEWEWFVHLNGNTLPRIDMANTTVDPLYATF